jgi:hypothetical protein
MIMTTSLNVYGQPLENCSCDPMTGYFRDGFCNTISVDSELTLFVQLWQMSFRIFIKKRKWFNHAKAKLGFSWKSWWQMVFMCFPLERSWKLMWSKNRFECNTSIGIRICIIRIITTVFYLRRSAINLATDNWCAIYHIGI